jgi:aerobic carbon-monoxide dehydrogenase large subunit
MNEFVRPSDLDRPNSYIGRSVPRPNIRRLVEGRGRYVDDITLPRMLHVAFVRSPHAHARIVSILLRSVIHGLRCWPISRA